MTVTHGKDGPIVGWIILGLHKMGSESNLLQKRWRLFNLRKTKKKILVSSAWWREKWICVWGGRHGYLLNTYHMPSSYRIHLINLHQIDSMSLVGKLRFSEEQWLVQGHKHHVLYRTSIMSRWFFGWSLPKGDSAPLSLSPLHISIRAP